MEMTKMEMKLDRHLLRKWRETRAWSQEHLAALAGLSLRTIQRIEADGRASAETRMALAAAFNVDVATLTAPETVPDSAAERLRWRLSVSSKRDALGIFLCWSICAFAADSSS